MSDFLSSTMLKNLYSPFIYNLFPPLVGHIENWIPHIERALKMGFNWIYINPIHYPGFSGSLYAPKDYYSFNPQFLPEKREEGVKILRQFIKTTSKKGLAIIMDLVINHTAKDSILTKIHPEWYVRDENNEIVSPFAIDPNDVRKKTIWGDLGELNWSQVESYLVSEQSDNQSATSNPNKPNLMLNYFDNLVAFYQDLGFLGFRCDAAYQIPPRIWKYLICKAKKRNPTTLFFAELMGAREEQIKAFGAPCVRNPYPDVKETTKFDFIFNSSKWWMFDAGWCLLQHHPNVPSISFPESHDTKRLFKETGQNLSVQMQRYVFAAFFSSGVMMPIGYEFCFQEPLNVITTKVDHWFKESSTIDLGPFIKKVNEFVRKHTILQKEGHVSALSRFDQPTIVLEKETARNSTDSEKLCLILLNKDWNQAQRIMFRWNGHSCKSKKLYRFFNQDLDDRIECSNINNLVDLVLEPAEVACILA